MQTRASRPEMDQTMNSSLLAARIASLKISRLDKKAAQNALAIEVQWMAAVQCTPGEMILRMENVTVGRQQQQTIVNLVQ